MGLTLVKLQWYGSYLHFHGGCRGRTVDDTEVVMVLFSFEVNALSLYLFVYFYIVCWFLRVFYIILVKFSGDFELNI